MVTVEDLVDRDRLRAFLASHLGETDTFEVSRHEQGFSNETLFVTWGEEEYVIRRPPPGDTAETAHDVLREYEVMDALQETDVPVARTVRASDDTDVIGCPFYVMERLAGDVLRYTEPDRFASRSARRTICEEMVDTLAAIHTVDVGAVGLEEFGHPTGFTRRQVERWSEQFEWAFEETTAEREVPAIGRIGDWLSENVPTDHPETLVHGDYKLDNVIFGPGTPPAITGVLDWEMSTLGDPLTDLGWLLFFWFDDAEEVPDILGLMGPQFLTNDDYYTRAELVERYTQQTGHSIDNLRFYRVLAVYKMAALGEMFFARYLMGHSDNTFYEMMEAGVPELAALGEEIIAGDRAV